MSKLFAVCAPGLESFTAWELEQMNLLRGPAVPSADPASPEEEADEGGGVEFHGALADLYRVNLKLRTASRVLLRLGEFYAGTFSDLGRRAKRLAWEEVLAPGQPIALRVTCRGSRLYHSGAVAERVTAAIADRIGQPPPVQKFQGEEAQTQLVVVRLVENRCTISVDTSGELLHRRGYRQATGKAPMRETLAAAVVLASRWDTRSPFLDPFCGAGTIAIEAALLARKINPGRGRSFAFMRWPNFDAALWEGMALEGGERLSPRTRILASDRDAGAIRSAEANAVRAGVADSIEFSCRAVSAIEPPAGPGWVVTNPPYGVRLKTSHDLRRLFVRFGTVLRIQCPEWHLAMICDSREAMTLTGLNLEEAGSLSNGGLQVFLAQGRIPRGQRLAAARPPGRPKRITGGRRGP